MANQLQAMRMAAHKKNLLQFGKEAMRIADGDRLDQIQSVITIAGQLRQAYEAALMLQGMLTSEELARRE